MKGGWVDDGWRMGRWKDGWVDRWVGWVDRRKKGGRRQIEEFSKRTSISEFLSLFPAAVDYLAKNVSLSTQRRMKLGEHSAVLGLLPVETGQAY